MKRALILPLAATVISVALVAFVALVVVGDDDDTPAAPEATATVTDTDAYGPEPVFGDNILAVRPEHRGSIPRDETAPENRNQVGGICAEVSFEGLPENNQLLWFQLAVDENIVTQDIAWFGLEQPVVTLCYQPDSLERLDAGRHTAALGLFDPEDPEGPPLELVAWAFDVTE